MRNALKNLRYTVITLAAILVVVALLASNEANDKSDEILAEPLPEVVTREEPETVKLSYEEYLDIKASCQQVTETALVAEETDFEAETWTSEQVNLDTMDVWTLGAYLYGIPEYDTTRSLILITFEGYGAESPLSYYVACCCWVRATEGCWGYTEDGCPSLYRAFGEADTWNYGSWLDNYGYADYAVEVLRECYLNPTYVKYCNGMMVPESWIYEEGGIYVWN